MLCREGYPCTGKQVCAALGRIIGIFSKEKKSLRAFGSAQLGCITAKYEKGRRSLEFITYFVKVVVVKSPIKGPFRPKF